MAVAWEGGVGAAVLPAHSATVLPLETSRHHLDALLGVCACSQSDSSATPTALLPLHLVVGNRGAAVISGHIPPAAGNVTTVFTAPSDSFAWKFDTHSINDSSGFGTGDIALGHGLHMERTPTTILFTATPKQQDSASPFKLQDVSNQEKSPPPTTTLPSSPLPKTHVVLTTNTAVMLASLCVAFVLLVLASACLAGWIKERRRGRQSS